MHAPNSIAAAAALLLCTASAMPNLTPIAPRQTDPALEPWVSVDEEGKGHTVTPVASTADGTPTVISAAPADITGTVVTKSYYGSVVTSTGTPHAPAPTGAVAGSFPVCQNKDGDHAPWCSPTDGTSLYPGTTYYFLWDPSYFSSTPNTTLMVQGNYFNTTTGEITDQAFESPHIQASWGFWSYRIESGLMKGQPGINITMQLATLPNGGNASEIIPGPKILVTKPPIAQQPPPQAPTGPALYIGLPVIFGFITLCLIGTCIWNRKSRRIDIGNVMSRSRHGFPLGKKARVNRKRRADERIQLMEHEIEAAGGEVYRDDPMPPRSRRDSDTLGSLVGTPTEDRRMDFDPSSTGVERVSPAGDGNRFRDELRRQDGGRF